MKKPFVLWLAILFTGLTMVACDSDWDGEITVTGGTKFPFWIK